MKWITYCIALLIFPAMAFIFQKYDSSQRYKGYDYYYRLRHPVRPMPMLNLVRNADLSMRRRYLPRSDTRYRRYGYDDLHAPYPLSPRRERPCRRY
jgi:hypothetical protein